MPGLSSRPASLSRSHQADPEVASLGSEWVSEKSACPAGSGRYGAFLDRGTSSADISTVQAAARTTSSCAESAALPMMSSGNAAATLDMPATPEKIWGVPR
jgi:hypothetical protein